ncbi:MAG: TolC family protein [Planctomycetaceae bacterium]|nr:TolC family protein [Planctomycetaceae bacterium]
MRFWRAYNLLRFAAVPLAVGFCGCAATPPRTDTLVERPRPAQRARQTGNSPIADQSAERLGAGGAGRKVVPASYESTAQSESTSRPVAAGQADSAATTEALKLPSAGAAAIDTTTGQVSDSESSSANVAALTDATDLRQPHLLDLSVVLQLVDGQNPQVLYARERIEEALAKLDRAEVLWLPSIRLGVNWNKHEGRIQDVAGRVIDTSRGSYFTGLGADAVGAGSPRIPGLLALFHTADAYFEPLIAERAAHARRFGSQATTNDAMLDSAVAYLELLRAHQELAIAKETRQNTLQLAELTALYASTGQGVAADDDRARAELAIRDNDLLRGDEAIQVASARLAEQLNLDSTLRFEPREPVVVPIELQAVQQPLPELVAYGLTHRPEVAESRSLAGEAVERLRREQYASLMPSLLLGLSYGGLGGGFGSNFVNFGDRLDADIVAWWEIRNLGFGERAARCEAQSRVNQAQLREVAALDRVAREVVEAHAQVESRRRQLATAEEGIRAAQSSYERNLIRIQNVQGLPLEALQSIQALAQARREYLRVVVSFNEAQFRLHRALGWPVDAATDDRL